MEEREIFKICLEYWAKLVAELYEELQQLPSVDSPLTLLGRTGVMQSILKPDNRTRNYYLVILSRLRVVMIEHMVKPEEVCLSGRALMTGRKALHPCARSDSIIYDVCVRF